jgi:hypothetical protein
MWSGKLYVSPVFKCQIPTFILLRSASFPKLLHIRKNLSLDLPLLQTSTKIYARYQLEAVFVSYSAPTSRTQKLKLMREGEHFNYSSTLPLICSSRRAQTWKRSWLPPGFELETSGSDIMLATLHQPIAPKILR